MIKPRVAITARSFDLKGPAFSQLHEKTDICYINKTGHRLDSSELQKAIVTVHAAVAGTEQFSRDIIESSKSLKIISRIGVGTDSIDLDTARKNGIRILTTPEAPAQSVAEHTIGLIFAVLKRIPEYNTNIRRNDWSVRPALLLSGKNAGIIGMGRIGKKVASMLSALGCKIRYYDPFVSDRKGIIGTRCELLEGLLRGSDIITLHTPPLPNNRPLLDERLFESCKKGCIIINTSRGSLLAEDGLLHALDSGRVSAAALDVFWNEPYHGPLLLRPEVIMTPHVASNTLESRWQMEKEAVENIFRAMQEGKSI